MIEMKRNLRSVIVIIQHDWIYLFCLDLIRWHPFLNERTKKRTGQRQVLCLFKSNRHVNMFNKKSSLIIDEWRSYTHVYTCVRRFFIIIIGSSRVSAIDIRHVSSKEKWEEDEEEKVLLNSICSGWNMSNVRCPFIKLLSWFMRIFSIRNRLGNRLNTKPPDGVGDEMICLQIYRTYCQACSSLLFASLLSAILTTQLEQEQKNKNEKKKREKKTRDRRKR